LTAFCEVELRFTGLQAYLITFNTNLAHLGDALHLARLVAYLCDLTQGGGPKPFAGDLLTSRLIAVMLLTIAVGAVYALRYADVSKVMLGVIAVYGFGVMVANLWNILANKPVNPSYVAAFGIMFLVSATLLIAER
jgi:hypothetical protein